MHDSDSQLLDEVTRLCMSTVLETIPEFGGDVGRAHAILTNFTVEQMRTMLENASRNDAHRIMAAIDESGHACGYSIYSLRHDPDGKLYGYLFSRGIVPEWRRRGIATQLLAIAEEWFGHEHAEYIQAETHVTNVALRTLLERQGFTASGPFEGNWPYYILHKEL